MKKTFISILIVLFTMSIFQSCEVFIGSAIDNNYYLSIIGDSGRQVQVSYYERTPTFWGQKDELRNETVSLPYFKQIHYNTHSVAQIDSKNDSTTKAIIFGIDVKIGDGKCYIEQVYMPEDAIGECQYCKNLVLDSLFSQLKTKKYPCYVEFLKTDESKKLDLNNIKNWNSKN